MVYLDLQSLVQYGREKGIAWESEHAETCHSSTARSDEAFGD